MADGLGPHALFIVASWAAAALVVAGLVAWVALDHRAQRRTLDTLDEDGRARDRRDPT